MRSIIEDKARVLREQASGYLSLSKGHCEAGNAEHGRIYLEEAKRLYRASQELTERLVSSNDKTVEFELKLIA